MVKNPINVKRGKKSRASGAEFERRTRKDLESQGWIVSKWMNNVELPYLRCIPIDSITPKEHEKLRCNNQFLDFMRTIVKHDGKTICENHHFEELGKLIPAKASRFRLSSTGFPDFVCYKLHNIKEFESRGVKIKGLPLNFYEVIGVEVKTNGYLDKTEKQKCQWLLDNQIFSNILIASKQKIKNRVKVIYTDFEEKYK